jgi:malate synthase
VQPEQLLDAKSTPGEVTEAGLRSNVAVAFQYISFWLAGRGAAGINNFMEDAATAEISRSQIWHWIRHGTTLPDGRVVSKELVRQVLDEETARIHESVGDDVWRAGRPDDTREVFEEVALGEELPEFLTLVAYDKL